MNDIVRAENPFGSDVQVQHNNAVAVADVARAIQEVQASMVIAKQFPRDQRKAMDNILTACTRQSLADAALYSYQRGGTEITGPSIRLAEALAQNWGNMQFGIRELSSENGVSSVEAFAWDMETNTRQVKTFQVAHIRSKKTGNVRLTDPRDIYELVANQGARRLRACILGVIPGDVTEAAVKQCDVTQANNVAIDQDAIKTMLEAFANYGVTQEMIEKKIQRRADAINAPLMLNMRRIMRSILDGMSKPSDWFEMGDVDQVVGPKGSELNDTLKKQAADKPAPEKKSRAATRDKPKEKPAPAPDQEAIEQIASVVDWTETAPDTAEEPLPDWLQEPGEGPEDPEQAPAEVVLTYAMVTEAINAITDNASNTHAVALMSKFIGDQADPDVAEGYKDELGKAYRWKLADMKKPKA